MCLLMAMLSQPPDVHSDVGVGGCDRLSPLYVDE